MQSGDLGLAVKRNCASSKKPSSVLFRQRDIDGYIQGEGGARVLWCVKGKGCWVAKALIVSPRKHLSLTGPVEIYESRPFPVLQVPEILVTLFASDTSFAAA